MKIALATDHAGYEQLTAIAAWLERCGHECVNFGPKKFDPGDDYPDFINPAAEAVANGDCQRGIIMGGSGQGEAMAANRHKNVRCVVFYGPATPKRVIDSDGHTSHNPYEIIKLSRQHNDSNMLSLASRFLNLDEMKYVINLWLKTDFSGREAHSRRNNKLDQA